MTNTFVGVGTLTGPFEPVANTNRHTSWLQVAIANKTITIQVTLDNKTLINGTLAGGTRVRVNGMVRSYRQKDEEGKWCNKVHVHADRITLVDVGQADMSYVHVQGTMLCEPYVGINGGKPVAQAMIHSERVPGRWYHVPVTAWNGCARYLAYMHKSDSVDIIGTLVSRTYNRPTDGKLITTCEVIVSRVLPLQEVC